MYVRFFAIQELWYLIGIQADITGLSKGDFPEDHIAELRQVASEIRQKLVKEHRGIAVEVY